MILAEAILTLTVSKFQPVAKTTWPASIPQITLGGVTH